MHSDDEDLSDKLTLIDVFEMLLKFTAVSAFILMIFVGVAILNTDPDDPETSNGGVHVIATAQD